MGINVARVCGLAWMGGLYIGIRDGILASPLSNNVNMIPKNSDGTEGYYEYANRRAKELGVNKEIIVIKGDQFNHYGNNLFSLRAGIQIDPDMPELVVRHWIIHEIVHIKNSDILTWTFVPLITSIFPIVMWKARFSLYGLVGLMIGVLGFRDLHQWREKQAYLTAMKHSSKEMNAAFLKWLEEEPVAVSFKEKWIKFVLDIFNPSTNEVISYYRAHLGIKV